VPNAQCGFAQETNISVIPCDTAQKQPMKLS
jgi:hypothetical protein